MLNVKIQVTNTKDFIARRYVLDYNEVNCTDLTKLPKHKIEKKKLTVEERL